MKIALVPDAIRLDDLLDTGHLWQERAQGRERVR